MKFELFQSDKSDKFYFRLKARNGQIILSSQAYTSKASAKSTCDSVSKHSIDDKNYERNEAENGNFYFNLKSSNGQIIATSQMYKSKLTLEKGVESVKRVAPVARIIDLTDQE